MKPKQYISHPFVAFVVIAALIMIYGCKRDWENPWDDKVDTSSWVQKPVSLTTQNRNR